MVLCVDGVGWKYLIITLRAHPGMESFSVKLVQSQCSGTPVYSMPVQSTGIFHLVLSALIRRWDCVMLAFLITKITTINVKARRELKFFHRPVTHFEVKYPYFLRYCFKYPCAVFPFYLSPCIPFMISATFFPHFFAISSRLHNSISLI